LSPAPEPVVSELIELLSLERLEDNLFRGQSRDIGTKYVFGGQVLGQALSAAQATVDGSSGERRAHSLHAYFLRAGNIEAPIVYEVDRTRDGGSFSVRRVTAPKRPPFQQVWFRLSEPVGDSPELHRALLAYASDFQLLGTATYPHGISYYQPNVQMASLDHALWFHRPFRADDWLLYSIDSPSASSSRGLARGQIFDRQGRLVASTAQEGLIRVVPDAEAASAVPAKD